MWSLTSNSGIPVLRKLARRSPSVIGSDVCMMLLKSSASVMKMNFSDALIFATNIIKGSVHSSRRVLMTDAEGGEFSAIDRLDLDLRRGRGEGSLKQSPEERSSHNLPLIDRWLSLYGSRGVHGC